MNRKLVPISCVIPDDGLLLMLGKVERLDVLDYFSVPIHIVDLVFEAATDPEEDRNEAVRRWWRSRHCHVIEMPTILGEHLRDDKSPGETLPADRFAAHFAIKEHAEVLAKQRLGFPLVLFDDEDVLELNIRGAVHLINTAGLLAALRELGMLDEGDVVGAKLDELRPRPMRPIDLPVKTRGHQSTLIGAVATP